MAYKKSVIRRKTYKKKAKGRKSYAKKAPKAMRKMVRMEISRAAENKNAQVYQLGQNLAASTGLGFNTQNIIPVCCSPTALQIVQGVNQTQRVGNKIKVKKLTFKGTLIPLPYNVSTNAAPRPLEVKMWIFYDKELPTIAPTPQSDFFQFGAGVTAFQNDLVDMWAPTNEDKYRVLTTRTFKLGSSTPDAATTSYNNNDFKLNCRFSVDLTKYHPKIVDFRDNNTSPTTRGLYAMFSWAFADGSNPAPTVVPANVSYILNMDYEDM